MDLYGIPWCGTIWSGLGNICAQMRTMTKDNVNLFFISTTVINYFFFCHRSSIKFYSISTLFPHRFSMGLFVVCALSKVEFKEGLNVS